MNKDFVWAEKYRPATIDECILPKELKETFHSFVKNGDIPNLLLIGPPGCGKTTIAIAMLKELECDYMVIDGSLKGDMDTLRNEIANFASTVSFVGKRKYIILDEADYINWRTQPALRNFTETYSSNCGFILTCNYANRILKELRSRCANIEFTIAKDERPVLAKQFLKRLTQILDAEGVKYDKTTLVEVITKYFPDWRRMLNEIQRYAVNGKIDYGILTSLSSISIKELVGYMKNKDFTKVRQWAAENLANDSQSIFREFYNEASVYFEPSYIPELVVTLAKYQHQALFSADQEINLAAFLVEVMVEAIWK